MAQYKIKLDIASGIDRTTGQYQIPYLQLKYMPLTIGGRRPKPVIDDVGVIFRPSLQRTAAFGRAILYRRQLNSAKTRRSE